MIAKRNWVATAALVVGGLTSLATGLAATGRGDRDRPTGGPAPTARDQSGTGRAAEWVHAVTEVPATEMRLASRVTAPGPACEPAAESPVSPVEQDQPARTVNYVKDLKPRRRMDRGDSLFSPMGGFRLHLRNDGNLVLSIIDDERLPEDLQAVRSHAPETMELYSAEIWSAGTNVPGDGAGAGSYCIMEEDGDFVVYDTDNKPRFRTDTRGHAGAFLRCQDDGNVVLYVRDPGLKAIWATNTAARKDVTAGSGKSVRKDSGEGR